MKVIFERETEIGKCNTDRIGESLTGPGGDWTAFAFTTAATSGTKGMLRVEQRCYIRSSESTDDMQPQNWVKPEITLEPSVSSKEETLRGVQDLHERFVQQARSQLLELSVLLPAVEAPPFTPEPA